MSNHIQPSNPLPVHFVLARAYSRRDAPLIPALYCDVSTHLAYAPTVRVYRLLDPELREPFISLARLAASSYPPLTPHALFTKFLQPDSPSTEFNPVVPTYSVLLGGLAPFADLWVPLSLAREVAEALGLLGLLGGLLDWGTRKGWSCLEWDSGSGAGDARSGELLSNWRIPDRHLSLEEYSVKTMQTVPFSGPLMLPADSLLRLPIHFSPSPPIAYNTMFESTLSDLVSYSVTVMEASVGAETVTARKEDPTTSLLLQVGRLQRGDKDKQRSITAAEALGSVMLYTGIAQHAPDHVPVATRCSSTQTPIVAATSSLSSDTSEVISRLSTLQETVDGMFIHIRSPKQSSLPDPLGWSRKLSWLSGNLLSWLALMILFVAAFAGVFTVSE